MVYGAAPKGAYALGSLERNFIVGDVVPELPSPTGTEFQLMARRVLHKRGYVVEYRPHDGSPPFQIPAFLKRGGSSAPVNLGPGAEVWTGARLHIAGLDWPEDDEENPYRPPQRGDVVSTKNGLFAVHQPWADRDAGALVRYVLALEGSVRISR